MNETAARPHPGLNWFSTARFGMFIHYGPYSVLGRGEWTMNQEGLGTGEYAALVDGLGITPERIRAWCSSARRTGMRYIVLTAKHHDGYCLWDSRVSPYNAMRSGPKFDVVRTFLEAAREAGLRVGLYYSLADWRHPDGAACATDATARKRFIAFTHALVHELCSEYGPLDLLWFDGPWPLETADLWDSHRLLADIRRMQPDCLVNNRLGSGLDGDFGTPEGHIQAETRPWEACMTFNGDWGWSETPDVDWLPARSVLKLLRSCAAQGGNLLLNVGPAADGAFPVQATERLDSIGGWLAIHGEACMGTHDRIDGRLPAITNVGFWTAHGRVAWFWLARAWCGPVLSLGGLQGRLINATLLHEPSRRLTWDQDAMRTRIHGLPVRNNEPLLGIPVLRLEFDEQPRQAFPYPGCAI